MPPILSTSKAIARVLSARGTFDTLGSIKRCGGVRENPSFLAQYSRAQCWSTSVCDEDHVVVNKAVDYDWRYRSTGNSHSSAAATTMSHEETRVIGYSAEQLFDVVAAVNFYEDFLPWCQKSLISRRYTDGSFDAELKIGFKFLTESYVSHVVLKRPNYIKANVLQCGLLDHLTNIWEFNSGPVPGSCNLHFMVDFKFQSPFYCQMASSFFKEVISRLIKSFDDRCRRIYGSGVRVA